MFAIQTRIVSSRMISKNVLHNKGRTDIADISEYRVERNIWIKERGSNTGLERVLMRLIYFTHGQTLLE
jgi:hypothetical protein